MGGLRSMMRISTKAVALASVSLLIVAVALLALYSPRDAEEGTVRPETRRTADVAEREPSTGSDDPQSLPNSLEASCERDLSQVANSSLVLAEQLPRRIRSYVRTLSARGFGSLEIALVAEGAGRRCITPWCSRHVPLGETRPLWSPDDTYSLPPAPRASGGTSVAEPNALHAAAEAVAADLPSRDFIALLDDVRPDLNATWRDSKTRRRVNLSTFAALRLRADHVQLLIERGASPVLAGVSVLDDLALKLPLPSQRTEALIRTARHLVQAGDQAFFPSTLALFGEFVAADLALSIHPATQLALATGNVATASKELSLLVEGWQGEIDDAVQLEERCAKLGHVAADPTGLPAKRRYEESRSRREQALLAEIRKAQRQDEERDRAKERAATAVDEGLASVLAAVAEDRWPDALALADEWFPASGAADWLYRDMLARALRYGAPLAIVAELADRLGGRLPPNAILELLEGQLSQDLFATILELEAAYGLDVHYVDDEGQGAMSVLARRFTGMPEFSAFDAPVLMLVEHLGEHGVTAKPDTVGFDPLDTVLSELLMYPRSSDQRAVLVRALLAAGAPLERSHFELLGQLADLDFDAYQRFIALVPELARPP